MDAPAELAQAVVPIFCSDNDNFSSEFSGAGSDIPRPTGVGVLVNALREIWLVTAFHVVFERKTRRTAEGEDREKLVHSRYIWVPVADDVPNDVRAHVSWYCFRPEAGKATKLDDEWADCVAFRMVTSSGHIAKPTSLAHSDFDAPDYDRLSRAAVKTTVNPRNGWALKLYCFRDGWAPGRRTPFILDERCQVNSNMEITSVFRTDNGDSGAPVFALDTFQGENTWGLAGLHLAVRHRYNHGDHGVTSHISYECALAAMKEQDLVYDESMSTCFELHHEGCYCQHEPCNCFPVN